jgi:hypothetical protein
VSDALGSSAHPDLVGLVRGELTNAEVGAADDHLTQCAQCREELIDTVVSHALLVRAGRTLGRDALPDRGSEHAGAHADVGDARPVLPAYVAPAEPGPRRGPLVLLAAAAAVVVAGAGLGAQAWLDRDGSSVSPAPREALLAASLEPLDGSAARGEVTMRPHDGRTELSVSVADLPTTSASDYYYAWLLDPATDKMLPLGQVDARRGATFDLDDSLVASYSAVDLSLEADDGDPAHSVTSVLRGTYPPEELDQQVDQLTDTQGEDR